MMFALEVWEWPPCAEQRYLVEPFESECLAEFGLTRITVCAVPYGMPSAGTEKEYLTFFRPEVWKPDAALKWLELAPGVPTPNYIVDVHWKFWPQIVEEQNWPTASTLEKFLYDSFANTFGDTPRCSGARFFHLPEGRCSLRKRRGFWHDAKKLEWDDSQGYTTFRLPAGLHLHSSAHIHHWLQTQLIQRLSEVSFSYQWNRKTPAQISDILLRFAPNMIQWQYIVNTVALAESTLHDSRLRWSLLPPKTIGSGELRSTLMYEGTNVNASHPALTLRLRLWGELLETHFPLFELDYHTTPHCLWYEYFNTSRLFTPEKKPTPTSHEQMEASFALHDWASDKVTPAEKAILFPAKP